MRTIKELKVIIIGYSNNEKNSWPGVLRCSFNDIYRNTHYIVDKEPVLSNLDLNENNIYPQLGYVKCEVVNTNGSVISIDINNPWSLEDENEETIFEVFANQLT